MWKRIIMRLGRRYWIEHADKVLASAKEKRVIDSWQLHELDARLKYHLRATRTEHRLALGRAVRE